VPRDWSVNLAARRFLQEVVSNGRPPVSRPMDVVLCHSEVNDRHGTGILIQRLFPRHRDHIVCVRAVSHWDGEQDFGARQLVIPFGIGRPEIYRWLLAQLDGLDIRNLYCIPYSGAEIIAALALADAYEVPLCLYIMDDQNIDAPSIPDNLMTEAIERATLRLAISSDMREAYESKYGRRFWIAPPTIPIDHRPPTQAGSGTAHGVIVGNIWGQEWLDALKAATTDSGLSIDWYANAPSGGFWLDGASLEELDAAGVTLHEPLPEHELAARLEDYEIAVLPTVPRSGLRDNVAVASLSLPSRVPFLIGASDLPIIVLGDPRTCVGRFVTHFGLGVASDYSPDALGQALAITRDPHWRARQRGSLANLRELLVTDIASWVKTALAHGEPLDARFEALQVHPPRFLASFCDEVPALGPWLHGFDPVHASLRRLASWGYSPDFIVDAGASTGVWSCVASRVFPAARFVLVEPLLSRHDEQSIAFNLEAIEHHAVCECALGDHEYDASVRIGANVFGTSLLTSEDPADPEVLIPVRTLDALSGELGLGGRGILKLDIQGAELEALQGARRLLADAIDAVVVEVSLDPPLASIPSYDEVHGLLQELGFTLFDDAGSYREPGTGMLIQKDFLYMRSDHRLAGLRRAA